MIMKFEQTVFLIPLILFCFPAAAPLVYYITPDDHADGTTGNGTTLSPCFTLGQLINNDILASSNERSIELSFLPGTHLILKNQTLRFSSFRAVLIQPWNMEREGRVKIQCQEKSLFHLEANVTDDLSISSLQFSGCALGYNGNCEGTSCKFTIAKCVIENFRTNTRPCSWCSYYYAVNVVNIHRLSNVTISNCTFSSNNGSVNVGLGTQVKLQVIDTIFQDNYAIYGGAVVAGRTVLTVLNCRFLNNAAGSPIFAYASTLLLSNTTFWRCCSLP